MADNPGPTITLANDAPSGRKVIGSYGDGGFAIEGVRYRGSILVFPTRVEPWPVSRFEDITLDSLAAVLGKGTDIEMLMVGCGVRGALAPVALRDGLRQAHIASDFMDTGAACRTFNVLLTEDRLVVAALIAVE
jgi:uncharacterized protein